MGTKAAPFVCPAAGCDIAVARSGDKQVSAGDKFIIEATLALGQQGTGAIASVD